MIATKRKTRGRSSVNGTGSARPKRKATTTRLTTVPCMSPSAESNGAAGEKDGGDEPVHASRAAKTRRATGRLPTIAEMPGEIAGDEESGDTDRQRVACDQKQSAAGSDGERANDQSPAAVCAQLQELQRFRVKVLKSRIMLENRLTADVASFMGYSAGLEEKVREERWQAAKKLIKQIEAGDAYDAVNDTVAVAGIVQGATHSINAYDATVVAFDKQMLALAKQLPVAKWFATPALRGVGLKSLAVIIGETGDLSLYANPAKVWKRLGCAPFNGRMPSTWRSGKEGKLSAEEWSLIGYSPRRRSVMYIIGECIVKQNGQGPFRKRYDEAKAAAHVSHPDWSDGRCHNHGMLLASKRLLRDLWREWNGDTGRTRMTRSNRPAGVLETTA